MTELWTTESVLKKHNLWRELAGPLAAPTAIKLQFQDQKIAALEARCRDYRDALEEIASYRGPDSGMDITARHMRDAAREAIGYETETKGDAGA